MLPATRKVVMQFLQDEAAAGRYSEQLRSLHEWSQLSDDEFIEKIHDFAAIRNVRHSVFTYTIGAPSDVHNASIRWEQEVIQLKEIFIERLTARAMPDLKASAHNLAKFAREHAPKYTEFSSAFRGSKLPSIIVLQKNERPLNDRYQILDGKRRAIALVRVGGIFEVRAWVGKSSA